MKCNEKGLDDPYCCRPGQQYDRTLKRCVPTKDPFCLRQTCPGFSEGICCFVDISVVDDFVQFVFQALLDFHVGQNSLTLKLIKVENRFNGHVHCRQLLIGHLTFLR